MRWGKYCEVPHPRPLELELWLESRSHLSFKCSLTRHVTHKPNATRGTKRGEFCLRCFPIAFGTAFEVGGSRHPHISRNPLFVRASAPRVGKERCDQCNGCEAGGRRKTVPNAIRVDHASRGADLDWQGFESGHRVANIVDELCPESANSPSRCVEIATRLPCVDLEPLPVLQ